MKRILIAAAAGVALFGATAASAQTFQNDGYAYSDDGYAYRGPLVERSVGLQIGPVGVYAEQPAYSDRTYQRPADSYNYRAFPSQGGWPQSPPSVGGN